MAETPAAAVADADIVVICVSDTPDVEAVLFGPAGVVDGARPGHAHHRLLDDRAVGELGLRRAARASAVWRWSTRPVSGGSEGAQKATLTIFVGGDAEDVERARPVLAAMGKTITHVGPIGAGQAVKAVNQVILAGTYLGVAEGIVLAIKAGLDVEQVVGALGGRRGPVLGPGQPQRPDARQRLPARVQGRAPPQGPRDRPRSRRASSARCCP